jgi:hypothetical protein
MNLNGLGRICSTDSGGNKLIELFVGDPNNTTTHRCRKQHDIRTDIVGTGGEVVNYVKVAQGRVSAFVIKLMNLRI